MNAETGTGGASAVGAAAPRRWLVLAAGTVALTAGSAFQYGLPYLIPALRARGLPLEQSGLIVACPTVGLLLTLVAWGAAADRWGERLVLGAGLTSAGLVLLAASWARGTVALGVCLAAAGAAGASVYAASGRLILGWFPARQRGLAMGIRQSSQPLGVALAGLTLPSLGAMGLPAALIFLGSFCLGAAALVAAVVRDPRRAAQPRPAGGGSPYRTSVLWRIHAASALLVVPQFAVATFALVYLVDAHGWRPAPAGALLAAASAAGAGSRLAAAVLVVSTNGLAFTAVAEHAGPAWAGKALGIQNTGQNILAAATPPVLAAVIGAAGYPAAFAGAAVFPLAAAALIPVARERSGWRQGSGSAGEAAAGAPLRR